MFSQSLKQHPALRAMVRSYAEAAASPAQMPFHFTSPTQVLCNRATVKQVDVLTLSGSFGILATHVPTLQVLKPGVVTVFAEDGTATRYFVSGGSTTLMQTPLCSYRQKRGTRCGACFQKS
uniref:ATP synthase F(1) complex subunit delta, mitochondrial n=1 Tax=Chelydra serpentina TaxID=8475 RepID=A0A8C3RJ21_CHESE